MDGTNGMAERNAGQGVRNGVAFKTEGIGGAEGGGVLKLADLLV